MPNMNGLELAKNVKKQYPTIPVIVLSSIGGDLSKETESLSFNIKQAYKATCIKPSYFGSASTAA